MPGFEPEAPQILEKTLYHYATQSFKLILVKISNDFDNRLSTLAHNILHIIYKDSLNTSELRRLVKLRIIKKIVFHSDTCM